MRMDLMKGVIDMHVHTNPDLRLRAYDDFELMEAAIRVGARAIVIKTHQGSTVDRAYLCNPPQRDRTWEDERLHDVRRDHAEPGGRRNESEGR